MPYSAYKLHSEQAAFRKNDLTETKPPDLNRSAGIGAGESSEILMNTKLLTCRLPR